MKCFQTAASAVTGLLLLAGVSLARVGPEEPEAPLAADVWSELDLQDGELQRIALPAGAPVDLYLIVSLGGQSFGLDMQKHSLRGEGFEVLVETPSGELERFEAPVLKTYRGRVQGPIAGQVAASRLEDGLTALVMLDNGEAWTIQPTGAAAGWHVAYRDDQVRDGDWRCGTDDLPRLEGPGFSDAPGTTSIGDKVCEIAFDADREFYQKNGSSVSQTIADIENILNGVELIYERDVQITYELSIILVRTAEPDPYSSTDAATLLDQFENQWAGSLSGVHRDISHLMTGKNLNGGTIGVAWLGTICSGPRSYGLSESRYTTNYNRRVTLTAHELGHNWQSNHCNGDGDCHIMCSGLGGCNGIGLPNFGTIPISVIKAFSNSTPCTPNEKAPTALSTPFFVDWDDGGQPSAIDWEFNQGGFNGTGAVNEPSGANSLEMSQSVDTAGTNEEIRTKAFALNGETGVTLSYYTEARGPEAGEALVAEYRDANDDWIELGRATSDGSLQTSFEYHKHTLPAGALYDGVRFRFRTEVDNLFDVWHLDNVKLSKPPVLSLITPPSPGQTAQARVEGLRPNQAVTLFYSFNGIGSGPCFFQDVCFDLLGSIFPLVTVNANGSGTANLFVPIPSSAPIGFTVYLQGFAGYAPPRQSEVTNAIPATVQ